MIINNSKKIKGRKWEQRNRINIKGIKNGKLNIYSQFKTSHIIKLRNITNVINQVKEGKKIWKREKTGR